MITPRQTRLLRVADLRSFQRAIVESIRGADLPVERCTAVIVPTRAAAEQLHRTVEGRGVVGGARTEDRRVVESAQLITREEWYDWMCAQARPRQRRLRGLEREVVFRQAAHEVMQAGIEPPFNVRPGLVIEIAALYDALRRQLITLEAFERLLMSELEASAGFDRGAERLLRQTRFLAAVFRGYEGRIADGDLIDEHGLRKVLLARTEGTALRHVVVTVGDQAADAGGLWPADFDLLARLAGLERIDIVATDEQLSAGFHERLNAALPGIEEERFGTAGALPTLIVPSADDGLPYVVRRDREEELVAIARSLRIAPRPHPLERCAVVFQRPLPYLYLARQVLNAAAIAYEAQDALPLAAEPYAAAVDLVFSFVMSRYTRTAAVALLRSPHLAFEAQGTRVNRDHIAALDIFLQKRRFLGGRAYLAELAAAEASRTGAHAIPLQAAAAAAAALSPLEEHRPASEHLDVVMEFLSAHAASGAGPVELDERQRRSRAAILEAIHELRHAWQRHGNLACPFSDVVATVRRWIEGQTFAPRTGTGGLQLVDAQAARYGEFDELFLVGLIDGDWPERHRRNIFYPPRLLMQLGWTSDKIRVASARAAFHDLLRLPTSRLSLSTIALEDDVMAAPASVLEDLEALALPMVREPVAAHVPIPAAEGMSADPRVPSGVSGAAQEWLALRTGRTAAADPRFHGMAAAQRDRAYAVSALERYLECPFKYFAGHVLRLEEEKEDEETLTPQERGRFIHDVFREFFHAWARAGRRSITVENIDLARDEFARIVERHLETLAEADRDVERTRLLGSAVASGLGDRLFRIEAERLSGVLERLLEYSLDGELAVQVDDETRVIRLHGTADRIDLIEDGTLRVIDYKTGRAPKRARAIQLPIYGLCAEQRLRNHGGREWRLGEAGYVAFAERETFVSMVPAKGMLDAAVKEGRERLLAAVDAIERGEFPPHPADTFLCERCAYSSVCREDYVAEE
ncbi:MAG: PD-(D/E)XK nuclease family protein [Acidobacteria bacterium]|nr:PD-(D/E)XK nuclease family protein [Acidobacteriota bacterium]